MPSSTYTPRLDEAQARGLALALVNFLVKRGFVDGYPGEKLTPREKIDDVAKANLDVYLEEANYRDSQPDTDAIDELLRIIQPYNDDVTVDGDWGTVAEGTIEFLMKAAEESAAATDPLTTADT